METQEEDNIRLLYLDGPRPEPHMLSAEPLLALIGTEESGSPITNISGLARYLRCDTGIIHKWIKGHKIGLVHAEQIAHKMGKHPLNIWGQEYMLAVYAQEMGEEWSKENKKKTRRARGHRKYIAKDADNE